MLQQLSNTDDDTLLMNVVIEQMTCDSDPDMGGAVQLMYIIKDLLDPENMLGAVNKQEKTDFLNYFYKHCMHVLIGEYAWQPFSWRISFHEKFFWCNVIKKITFQK